MSVRVTGNAAINEGAGFPYDYESLQRPREITQKWYRRPNLNRRYIAIIVGIIFVTILALGIAYGLGAFDEQIKKYNPNPTTRLLPSASKLRLFRKAAVCADGGLCAEIGRDVLLQNGSAVDAALATLFCNGVFNMQSMGLGGGFLMTIYLRKTKTAYALNAREVAPSKIKLEMFKDHPEYTQKGPLSVGVPGELRGYWAAHKKFGKLPWADIVQPAIDLCESGYYMSQHQYTSLTNNNNVKNDPNLREWFTNEDGSFKKAGTLIVPTKLCETLKIIAENGGDDLYNGTLSKMFLEDLKDAGSIISKADLQSYHPSWMNPVNVVLSKGHQLHTLPPPGSGILLAFIMHILNGYDMKCEDIRDEENTIRTLHRMVEAFKYAYARRTELGDPRFVNIRELMEQLTSSDYAESIRLSIKDNETSSDPGHYGAVFYNQEDKGTAHISVLAENGDAVSVTSTVNMYFGAGFTSEQTGILLNSGIDDFSIPYHHNYFGLPGSPNNKLQPGKQAMSSMTPSVVTDAEGNVKLVIGGAGGTKITTAIAQVLARVLWFGQNIKEAIDEPRIHHQLFPMKLQYEYGLLQQYVDGLEAIGHKMERFTDAGSVVCGLHKKDQHIYANADVRKGGDVHGID